MEKPQMLAEVEQSVKNKSWGRELLTCFFLLLVGSFMGSLFLDVLSNLIATFAKIDSNLISKYLNYELPMPQWMNIIMLIGTGFITFVCIHHCRTKEKRSYKSIGFVRKGWVKEYLVGLGIGLLAFTIEVTLILCIVGGKVTFELTSSSILLILLFFIGFIIQGMSEEVLCRGYLMNTLTKRYSIALAITMNSILFGVLHLANDGVSFLAFINLVLFGIFMSIYMIRRGNIWGVCAIHTAWNFVQGNIFGLSVSGMEPLSSIMYVKLNPGSNLVTGGAFGIEGSIISTICLVCWCILAYKMKQQD